MKKKITNILIATLMLVLIMPLGGFSIFADNKSHEAVIESDAKFPNPDHPNTVYDGGYSNSVFYINCDNGITITITGITFKNLNNAGYGNCLYVDHGGSDKLTINFIDCSFINCGNVSCYGGAIYAGKNGPLEVNFENCIAINCKADCGGFIYSDNLNATFNGNGSTICYNCTANKYKYGYGGAVYSEKGQSLNGFAFENCLADYGGAVYSDGGGIKNINNCYFFDNFSNNNSDNGGAIYLEPDNASVSNCVFYNNGSFNSMSDIYTQKNDTKVSDCTFYTDTHDLSTHINSNCQTSNLSKKPRSDFKLNKSEDSKYHIGNNIDWYIFNRDVNVNNKTFKDETVILDSDVVLHTPIGHWANDDTKRIFNGTFDGNNHIAYVCMTDGAANNGVFSFTQGATIKNLTVKGYVNGGSGAAGVVAHAEDTTIYNCTNYAEIHGTDYTGGIVGYTNNGSKVFNCQNFGNITSSNQQAGGIVGVARSSEDKIYNCVNNGNVSVTDKYAGGIAGVNYGTISNSCCNSVSITGNNTGMIVGINATESNVSGIIVECYFKENDDSTCIDKLNSNILNAKTVFGDDYLNFIWYPFVEESGKIVLSDKDFTYVDYDKENKTFINKTIKFVPKVYKGGDIGTDNANTIYIVNSNITVTNRIYIKGNVRLIINDDVKITAQKGIHIQGGTLSICPQSTNSSGGTIEAYGFTDIVNNAQLQYICYSAIGGNGITFGGTLNIYGGTIFAKGSNYSSGIGGGSELQDSYGTLYTRKVGNSTTINIYGGSVTAEGGQNAAGIGGGYGGYGSTVNIYGGNVTATGGTDAAGIGGGWKGSGNTVKIYGGIVNATGANGGKGIGGGAGVADGGTIEIYGGKVTGSGFNAFSRFPFIKNRCYTKIFIDGQEVESYTDQPNVTIDATVDSAIHKCFVTYPQVDPLVDVHTGEIVAYGVKEYYKCDCGRYWETNNNNVLCNEITDLDYWKNNEGKISTCDIYIVIFKDGDNETKYYLRKGMCLSKDDIPEGVDNVNGLFFEWQYNNAGFLATFNDKVVINNNVVATPYRKTIDEVLSDTAVKTINSDTTEIYGIYVVNSGSQLVVNNRVKVKNRAVIILKDGCDILFNKGINVSDGNTLSIFSESGNNGTGILTAKWGDAGENRGTAGIGSDSEENAGTINIYGGIINATGGNYSAGIGAGGKDNGNFFGNGGKVNIYGGTITAQGGLRGAGIGSDRSNSAGTISIYGGKIKAYGGSYAPGIGGEDLVLNISDGIVVAIGQRYAAGIGGGMQIQGGNVTITGGIVMANGGGEAAGIGGGESASGGNVSISGGIVTATGQDGGKGIGGGAGNGGGTLEITGGTVYASGSTGVGGDATIDNKLSSYEVGGDDLRTPINNSDASSKAKVLITDTTEGKSLTLGSDISINFYKILTADEAINSTMTFKVGDKEVQGVLAHSRNGFYYECPLNVLQMGETIEASFKYNNVTTTQTYSINEYLTSIINGSYSNSLKALAKKVANYGHYVQSYLANIHSSTVTIGQGGYTQMPRFTDLDINVEEAMSNLQDRFTVPDLTGTGMTYGGRTVNFDSATSLNYYITTSNGQPPTVVCNDKNTSIIQTGVNEYKVSINDINATELNTPYTVTINGVDFTCSVLDYCGAVIHKENQTSEAKKAMAAFYEYYKAAITYASHPND